jgi:WD40 repeat protein
MLEKLRVIQADPAAYAFEQFENLLNKLYLREAKLVEAVHDHFDVLINRVIKLRDDTTARLVTATEQTELSKIDLDTFATTLGSFSPAHTIETTTQNENTDDQQTQIEATFKRLTDQILGKKIYELSAEPVDLDLNKLFGDVIERKITPSKRHGKLLKTIHAHSWGVYALALGKRGELISGSYDQIIKVWNIHTGECLRVLKGHSSFINVLLTHGSVLYSGSADGTIRCWSLDTFECLKTVKAHELAVTAIVADSERGQVVSAAADGSIKIWHSQCKRCLGGLVDQNGPVQMLVVNRAGQLISAAKNGGIKLWDLSARECRKTFEVHTRSITGLLVDKQGRLVTTCVDSGSKFKRLDLVKGDIFDCGEWPTALNGRSSVNGICFTANGELVAWRSDGVIGFFDLVGSAYNANGSFSTDCPGHAFAESLVVCSGEEKEKSSDFVVAVGLNNGMIELWSVDRERDFDSDNNLS